VKLTLQKEIISGATVGMAHLKFKSTMKSDSQSFPYQLILISVFLFSEYLGGKMKDSVLLKNMPGINKRERYTTFYVYTRGLNWFIATMTSI